MCMCICSRERVRETQRHSRFLEASAQSRNTVISTTVHCSRHQTVQNQGERKQTSAFNNRSLNVFNTIYPFIVTPTIENISIPLVFTSTGLNNLNDELYITYNEPTHKIIDVISAPKTEYL